MAHIAIGPRIRRDIVREAIRGERVEHYVAAGQIAPVLPITRSYVGGWAVLVPITGFTGSQWPGP